MSFNLTSYRISLEGLRLLIVDLSEIHDHLRDLCTEKPSQLHRATLSSFRGDLIRLHRQADISLAVIKDQLKEDKESISALAKVYRQDNYVGNKVRNLPLDPAPAALDRLVNDDRYQDEDFLPDLPTTKKVTTTFDPLPF